MNRTQKSRAFRKQVRCTYFCILNQNWHVLPSVYYMKNRFRFNCFILLNVALTDGQKNFGVFSKKVEYTRNLLIVPGPRCTNAVPESVDINKSLRPCILNAAFLFGHLFHSYEKRVVAKMQRRPRFPRSIKELRPAMCRSKVSSRQ